MASSRLDVEPLYVARDRADFSGVHRPVIHADHGRDADGSPCKEEFIASIELAAIDGPFHDLQAEFALRKLQDAIPGDAFEDVFIDWRGDQLAVAHHEEVAGGAFGDVAVFIEEDRFVESVAGALRRWRGRC